MGVLVYLKESAFGQWLTFSMLGAPSLIALHSVGMAVVVGLSLIIAMRLNGLIGGLDARLVPRLIDVSIWGFLLNLVTGLGIFITRGPEYLQSYMFLLKMLLVGVSVALLLFLRRHLKRPERLSENAVRSDDNGAVETAPPDVVARRLSLTATITFFAAVIAGRLIAYLSSLYT